MSAQPRSALAPAPEPNDPEFLRGFPQLFRYVQELCARRAGIHLPEGKKDLVRSRIAKRVRAHHLTDFGAYLEVLRASDANGEERVAVEALTTNLTYFYREDRHFDVLAAAVPHWRDHPLRVWSAGCSSGEEPYTLAMTLSKALPSAAPAPKILATDLSTEMVRRTAAGRYAKDRLKGVPADDLKRFFRLDRSTGEAVVEPGTRSMVQAARLNLMGPWPMKRPFHVIMCRNVMIYFTAPTRQELIRRYHAQLREDGLLFVGLSESLNSLDVPFEYVEPGVYRPL